MKIILQSEAAECGLAALAIVADHYGLHTSLAELRQRFAFSLKGVRLDRLMIVSQELGFSARALRVELDDLPRLGTPCILHWNMKHFVVLAKAGGRKLTIIDPAFGERRLSLEQVSEHFTGVVLELTPTADFRPRPAAPAVTVGQLTGKVHGMGASLASIMLLSMALQVFVLLAPFLMQWVVDQVLVSADRDLLAVLGVGFGLAMLLQVGINLLRGWSVVQLSSKFGLQWTANVFAHLLRLPLEFFQKRHLGDVTSRLNSVHEIQRVLTSTFLETVIDGLMASITLLLMLAYSWKLTLVTLLAVAAYALSRVLSFRPLRDRTEMHLTAAARQESHLLESLRGMQSLKVAGQEASRRVAYENLMVESVNQEIGLSRIGLAYASVNQLLFGAERIAVLWIAASFALANVFSVGMLVAYLAYKDQFAQRVGSLIDSWIEFRMLRLHGERLADIALAEPEQQGLEFESAPPSEARIEVLGLSFRYGSGESWVLQDCNFVVEAGESVAIVGASGCGKTTLVKLLLGLLTPTEGRILIGGGDLHKLGPRNVRAIVGAVMQDDQLFAGSMADNISFFDLDFDQERVESAARLAAIHDEIVAMPMGYHSLIGDMGSTLSGGQKQRVILARALYRSPKLLFLDEATSHLDVTKERLVNDAVRRLKLTTVIVAHRPETIDSADRVLLVENGTVTHERAGRSHRDLAAEVAESGVAALAG